MVRYGFPGRSVQLDSLLVVAVDCTRRRRPETRLVKCAWKVHGLLARYGMPVSSTWKSPGAKSPRPLAMVKGPMSVEIWSGYVLAEAITRKKTEIGRASCRE